MTDDDDGGDNVDDDDDDKENNDNDGDDDDFRATCLTCDILVSRSGFYLIFVKWKKSR